MSKYAKLIEVAKGGERPSPSEPENQTARKPEIKKTRKPKKKVALKPKPADFSEAFVNLGVKVPLSWRRHWAAESKKTGVTMTEIIVEALTDRFGKPE
jgi:hypothetical protein